MIPVFSPVIVSNEKHEWHGQVGTAQGDGKEKDTTLVHFDDGDKADVKTADLRVL